MATLLSVNVGRPRDVSWQGRTVHTGAWKSAVQGPRMVRRLNIEGDGQGDLAGHGGEMRAVLVYQLQSYQYWREELGRDDLVYGMFGENFTVDGLPDREVCIGDRYRIGEAEFEVTQPRVTCYRVGMRLGEPTMAALLVAHHRPGFYLRVITEGHVQAGDDIVLVRKGPEELSVADTDALLYLPDRDPAMLRRALNIPALSPGWKQSFRELAARPPTREPGPPGEHAGTRRPAEASGWPGFRTMRVARIVPETPAISSVYLDTADGTPLPGARAGQYLSVRIPVGDAGPVVRSYSLSSAPTARFYRISVKHEPHGTLSGYIHAVLRPGDLVEVASPRGSFVLEQSSRPIVLASAGIGATPLLAMLHQLADARDPRPVWWIHTARDRAHHAFAEETHTLLGRLPNAREHIQYTAATASRAHEPGFTRGRPTAQSLRTMGIPADADAYLCGPLAFMDDLSGFLRHHGLSAERIHTERFGALPAINPGVTAAAAVRPHQPPGPVGTGPLVTFARSAMSTPWSPVHASLLGLAEACDIPTRWACRTGVCHTCVTHLMAGDIAYTPQPLELPEAGTVLVCCSAPTSEVVLDL